MSPKWVMAARPPPAAAACRRFARSRLVSLSRTSMASSYCVLRGGAGRGGGGTKAFSTLPRPQGGNPRDRVPLLPYDPPQILAPNPSPPPPPSPADLKREARGGGKAPPAPPNSWGASLSSSRSSRMTELLRARRRAASRARCSRSCPTASVGRRWKNGGQNGAGQGGARGTPGLATHRIGPAPGGGGRICAPRPTPGPSLLPVPLLPPLPPVG